MRGWPGLNEAEWDRTDLAAAVDEYQPAAAYCCCLAVQPEIAATDLDIVNPEHAHVAAKLADEILGKTPLVRMGLRRSAFLFTATVDACGRASCTLSKSSPAAASSSPMAGIRKLAGHTAGRTPHRGI